MKNKKGFTLIEIIICIGVLALIGTVSFVGINKTLNANKITSLSQVEDEILSALNIYIETNDNVKNQLYEAENALITPIQLLINEGLLDLSDTDIPANDIKENYLVTAFMSDKEKDYTCTNAMDLRTITSWDESLSQPLYICTTIQVNGETTPEIETPYEYIDNIYGVSNQDRYYVDPLYNYVKYVKDETSYTYRMLYVDKDGSFVLVNKGSNFNNVFEAKMIDQISVLPNLGCAGSSNSSACISVVSGRCGCWKQNGGSCCGYFEQLSYNSYDISNKTVVNGATNIDLSDIKEAISSGKYSQYRYSQSSHDASWTVSSDEKMAGIFPVINKTSSGTTTLVNYSTLKSHYKIRLKSCVNIVYGTGRVENPYILEDKCEEDE